MDISITLNYGPIEAEFTGNDREELQAELLEFKEFLDTTGAFNGSSSIEENNEAEQIPLDESVPATEEPEEEEAIREALSPVARATGIPEKELVKYLYVDPDGEEDPEILIDDPEETFDNTKVGKQNPASKILLYLWNECYDDKEEFQSSELKDALAGSGIDPSYLYNMYDDDFKRSGPNNNILKLSRSGQLQAQEEIENLIQDEE